TLLIQDAVSLKLSIFIRYGLQVAAGIILMIFISPRLTVAIVLSLPVLIGISMFLGKRLKYYSKRTQAELGRATSIAGEVLSGIKIVKAFGRESFEIARFSEAVYSILRYGTKRTNIA